MRKLRTAAYIRISTLQEKQAGSFLAQFLAYKKMIESNPEWQFVGIFGDKGKGGTGTKNRVGFSRMINAARAGEVNLILAKSISRFSRNVLDTLIIMRERKTLDVEVYFEEQHLSSLDPKCEPYLSIMGSLAQEESRNLSENIKWGITRKMEKGEFTLP